MNKLKKIFGNTDITWKFLILFSILIGLVVGILNRIPVLNNTSFQDIAIVFDMWFILAIFIIVNCSDWKEAVLKCFVFFLISQPLIYMTEILIDVFINGANFNKLFSIYFNNYYLHGWFIWTLLTIPGAFVAYQIKRNNILSAFILSFATVYLSYMGTIGLIKVFSGNFPYHLLNSIICLVMAYVLIIAILDGKKQRIIAFILTTFGILFGIINVIISSSSPEYADQIIDFNSDMEIVNYEVEDDDIAILEIEDTFMVVKTSDKFGTTNIKLTDKDGNTYNYVVTSSKGNFVVEEE